MKVLLGGNGQGTVSCTVVQGKKITISIRDGNKRVGNIHLRHKHVKPHANEVNYAKYDMFQIRINKNVVFFAPVEHRVPIQMSRDRMPFIQEIRCGASIRIRPEGTRQTVVIRVVDVSSKSEPTLWVKFEIHIFHFR